MTILAAACDSSSQPSSAGPGRPPETTSSSAPSAPPQAGPDIKSQVSPGSDSGRSESTSETIAPPPAISAPVPAAQVKAGTSSAPSVASSVPASPYGPPTLDETIFATDIIAIVRPISSESATLTIRETNGQTIYSPVVQSQFEVVEYLKGDGDSEIVVNANNFSIKSSSADEALQNVKVSLAAQASSLDGEAGVVFIQHIEYPENVLDISLKQNETEWRRYNVQTGLFSTRGDVGSSSATLHIASGMVAASARGREVFSVGRLRDRIEAMKDLLSKGEGIGGYEKCIGSMLLHENFRRKHEDTLTSVFDVEPVPSGLPAEYLVEKFNTTYAGRWFTGDNAHLFHYGDNQLRTTRPVAAGSYQIYAQYQKLEWVPCDYVSPAVIWRYNFEPSDGVLHEAFFDPVALGDAVGADGASGVLKPASFAFDGSDAAIRRIDWLDGQVRMSFSPRIALPDHHIDFIALDGSVSLRLDFDDAVEVTDDDGRQSLVWGVCSQPWQAGDLLMLRIAAGIPDDGIEATNDPACP